MAIPIKMPKIGLSDESAIIAKWHKKKGEQVKKGEILFTIETDKSTFDVEAEADGILLDIFFNEGDEVPVLTDVGVIGNEGENLSKVVGSESPDAIQDKKLDMVALEEKSKEDEALRRENINPELPEQATQVKGDIQHEPEEGRTKISPRARHLAERAGVDLSFATSTGPEGRIIERDIVSLIENGPLFTQSALKEYEKSGFRPQPIYGSGIGGRITSEDIQKTLSQPKEPTVLKASATPEKPRSLQKNTPENLLEIEQQYEVVKFTNIRKVISKNMMSSLANSAQLTHDATFDATEILAYREKIKANKDKYNLENITLNDMVLYAVSRTLLNHRTLNAHLIDDTLHVFENVHLGVAIDTDRGLMVPTIFNANLKSLDEISREVKELAEQCRKGSINPDYLRGGTFTVTNLGTLDVEHFTPILNPPQTGILGVCSITYRPRFVDGHYDFYPAMGLSLTFDHRAVDGAPAARFLKELKTNLENFSLLLAK